MPAFLKPGSLNSAPPTSASTSSSTFHAPYTEASSNSSSGSKPNPPTGHQQDDLNRLLYSLERHPVTLLLSPFSVASYRFLHQIPANLLAAGWADSPAQKGIVGFIRPTSKLVESAVQQHRANPHWISSSSSSSSSLPSPSSQTQTQDVIGYRLPLFRESYHPIKTKVLYTTPDQLFFNDLQQDPLLSKYSVLVLEAVDQRTLYMDLLLSLLKKVLKLRPTLRVLLTATTPPSTQYNNNAGAKNASTTSKSTGDGFVELVQDFFAESDSSELPGASTVGIIQILAQNNNAKTLSSTAPNIAYLEQPCQDYVAKAVETVWRIHGHQEDRPGDILVFLPTVKQVNQAVQELADRQAEYVHSASSSSSSTGLQMKLVPLYSSVPDNLVEVMDSAGYRERKVIVATIADDDGIHELNLPPIPNIQFVVDSGFYTLRVRQVGQRGGVNSTAHRISTIPEQIAARRGAHITAAAAAAAGWDPEGSGTSMGMGLCYRLYTEQDYNSRIRSQHLLPPQMTRSDLCTAVLGLKALGVQNLAKFDYFPPSPPPEMLADALTNLVAYGVLQPPLKTSSSQTGPATSDAGVGTGKLTPLGQTMSRLPLEVPVPWQRVLIESARVHPSPTSTATGGCAQEALTILSMFLVCHTESSLFIRPKDPQTQLARRRFTSMESDFLLFYNVFTAFKNVDHAKNSNAQSWCKKHSLRYDTLVKAKRVRNFLQTRLRSIALASNSSSSSSSANATKSTSGTNSDVEDQVQICDPTSPNNTSCQGDVSRLTRTFLSGFFPNLAKFDEASMTYKTIVHGEQVSVHPDSTFFNRRPTTATNNTTTTNSGSGTTRSSGRECWIMFGEKKSLDDDDDGDTTRGVDIGTSLLGAGAGTSKGARKSVINHIWLLGSQGEMENLLQQVVPGYYEFA